MADIYTSYLDQVVEPSQYSGSYTQGMSAMVQVINNNFQKLASEPILRGDRGTSVRTEENDMWYLDGNVWKVTDLGAKVIMEIYGADSGDDVLHGQVISAGDTAASIFGDPSTTGIIPPDAFVIGTTTSPNSFDRINPLTTAYHNGEYCKIRTFVTDEARSLTKRFFTTLYTFNDARIPSLDGLYNEYINLQRSGNSSINSQFDVWYDRTCSIYASIDETVASGWTAEYYSITPKLYWQSDLERFCWQINNIKTGVSAQGIQGIGGTNAAVMIGCGTLNSQMLTATQVRMGYFLVDDPVTPGQHLWSSEPAEHDNLVDGTMVIAYICEGAENPTAVPPVLPYNYCGDVMFGILHVTQADSYIDYFRDGTVVNLCQGMLSNNWQLVGYSASNTFNNTPAFPRGYILMGGDILQNTSTSTKVGLLYSDDDAPRGQGTLSLRRTPLSFAQNHTNTSIGQSDVLKDINNYDCRFNILYNTYLVGKDGHEFHSEGYSNNNRNGINYIKVKNGIEIHAGDLLNTRNIELYSTGDNQITAENYNIIIGGGQYQGNNSDTASTQIKALIGNHTQGSITATVGKQTDVYLGCPIGTIVMYAGKIEDWFNSTEIVIVEKDWLICNGADISNHSEYNKLSRVLGRNTLPDLRQRFPLGATHSRRGTANEISPQYRTLLHEKGGEHTHTLRIEEMPTHNHKVELVQELAGSDSFTYLESDTSGYHGSWSDQLVRCDYAGGGQPHNNVPQYYAVYFIIKYR